MIKDFFTEEGGKEFVLFGSLHMSLILTVIIIAIIIYYNRFKLRKFKYKELIAKILVLVLFFNMFIYYTSMIILGVYDWHTDLPLHFCFITGYLLMFTILTKNKKLYKIIYFWTFVGPLPAMILPDITQSYNRFIFWQFTISHHLMLLTSLYTMMVLEYKIEKKDILKSLIWGNIMFTLVIIFNNIMHTNYIMVGSLPEHIYRLFPFVKILPPIFWLELVGILALLIAYIPASIVNKSDLKSKVGQSLMQNQELEEVNDC